MKLILGNNQSMDTRIYQGVITQELQKIAPDMVREVIVNKVRYLEVDPNKFPYALINAVQEQQNLINEQKQLFETQNTKIEHLETQLKKQRNELEVIKAVLSKQ